MSKISKQTHDAAAERWLSEEKLKEDSADVNLDLHSNKTTLVMKWSDISNYLNHGTFIMQFDKTN